jgi:hypothetical protein
VMAELVDQKAPKIIPSRGNWKVYFLGFSRSGWRSGAFAYQEEINRHPVQGENWGSIGIQLVTLDGLDEDLTRWTK